MEIPILISSAFKLFEMVPTLLLFTVMLFTDDDSVMSHRKFAAVCCAMKKSRHARNNMKSGMQVMARISLECISCLRWTSWTFHTKNLSRLSAYLW